MKAMSIKRMLDEKKKWYLDKPEDNLFKLLKNRHGIFFDLMVEENELSGGLFGFDDFGTCPYCGNKEEDNDEFPSAKQMLENNLKNILTAIENGADVNDRSDSNTTILHRATCQVGIPNNLDIIKKLIQYGADVNALNDFGKTPLYFIADSLKHSDIETAKLLIEAGTDSNKGNPLLGAADRLNLDMVKYLISVGADVNQRDLKGNAPLAKAIKNEKHYSNDYMSRYNSIAKLLIDSGADLNTKFEYGNAYQLAKYNKEISDYLEGLKEKHTFNDWLKKLNNVL